MNCPKCNAINDDQNLFCVNCGIHFYQSGTSGENVVQPTQDYNQYVQNQSEQSPKSVETAFVPNYKTTPAVETSPPISYDAKPKKSRKGLILAFVSIAMIGIIIVVGAAGYYFYNQQQNTETLPDHLGMFLQSRDKKRVEELKKQDLANVLEGKESLLKDESLPVLENNANVFMYLDSSAATLNDLKLVQLDSIKEDGALTQINYQAVPVEGKTDMKRLRVPNGLANGKYAFALFDGFLNEGKHKFWAFQVKDANKTDNGDLAKAVTISLKPSEKETQTPTPEVETAKPPAKEEPKKEDKISPPTGSIVAFCNSNSVVVRGSPDLDGKKIGSLRRNQRVFILETSSHGDNWNGVYGTWSYIQTENGKRGWVFSPLLSY